MKLMNKIITIFLILINLTSLAQDKTKTLLDTNKKISLSRNDYDFTNDQSQYLLSLSAGLGYSYGVVGLRYQARINGKTLKLSKKLENFGIGVFAGLGVVPFNYINKYDKSYSIGIKSYYKRYNISIEYGRVSLSNVGNKQIKTNLNIYFIAAMLGSEVFSDNIGFSWSLGIANAESVILPAVNLGIILKYNKNLF